MFLRCPHSPFIFLLPRPLPPVDGAPLFKTLLTRLFKVLLLYMRLLTFLLLFAISCSPPLPTDRSWIHVPTDFGMMTYKYKFLRPPVFPATICVDSQLNFQARAGIAAVIHGILWWEAELGPHIDCSIFSPRPIGSDCTIVIREAHHAAFTWEPHYEAAALPYITSNHRIGYCEIFVPDDSWQHEQIGPIITHELGHCLGLDDDPRTEGPRRSIMQGLLSNAVPRLTEMDARLVWRYHQCH